MTIKLDFGAYLMNESRTYLGERVGNILTALQSLHDDSSQIGSRQLVRAATGIVNQIRKILHDDWPDSEISVLKSLQRVGVALKNAMELNGDLAEVLAAAVQDIEQSMSKSKMPANNLASVSDEDSPE